MSKILVVYVCCDVYWTYNCVARIAPMKLFSILARLARFVIFVIYLVIGCCLQIEGDHLSRKPENVREF